MYEREKKNVLDACLWLWDRGFFGTRRGAGGNVSVRIEDVYMAITPSGVPYGELTLEDICILDLEGNEVEVKKGRTPSIEKALHATVYKIRPEITACVHTHQTYASVVSVLEVDIPPLFDEASSELGQMVETIPYALSGSRELAQKVASKIHNGAFAFILQNHGALLLGESIEKALLRAELLEKVAQVFCLALSTGKKIRTL
ncbi:MAG: class II aldolase/adducin family protein [Syntrophales bacterium]|nr:class II aldolase/adducin family protein [Syntrophales bacterium]